MAKEYSPGLQPWVMSDIEDRPESGDRVVTFFQHERPLQTVTLFVTPSLVQPLVIRPPLSGRSCGPRNPGLKPWAILFRHFMAGSGMILSTKS